MFIRLIQTSLLIFLTISILGFYNNEDFKRQKTKFKNFSSKGGNKIIGTSSVFEAIAGHSRKITVGRDSSVHVVWFTEEAERRYVLYTRSNDNGNNWTEPKIISDGYYGYRPSIDIDHKNPMNVHVVYSGYLFEGENRKIRYLKSQDGGNTWMPSILVSDSNDYFLTPDIIVDRSGNPHIVFVNGTKYLIQYNYSPDGGIMWLSEPENVNTGVEWSTYSPIISLDTNENPHVIMIFDISATEYGKGIFWNWRDMTTGKWQQTPPLKIDSNSGSSNLLYPSMVFGSGGIGHLWYEGEGTSAKKVILYRQYHPLTGWCEKREIPSAIPGGYTRMAQAAIDAHDNLYLCYIDQLNDHRSYPVYGDFFTGTNINGSWHYANVSGNGIEIAESYPGAARRVLADSLFHCIYSSGEDEGPVDIIYQTGFPWEKIPRCEINQLPDTYFLTGSFHITAETYDVDGSVEACSLYVWQNSKLIYRGSMARVTEYMWESDFTILGNVGDEVSYQAFALDNENRKGFSAKHIFRILHPSNPNATILFVADDIQILEFYEKVIGYDYEFWNTADHHGIDASVTTWGWNIIIVAGSYTTAIPTRDYRGNALAEFLQKGGGLLLTSDNYYNANDEEQGQIAFNSGDFAYDFFQMDFGINDPDEKDSLFIGVKGDPISENFSSYPLQLYSSSPHDLKWSDYTDAAGCMLDCFYAFNMGYGAGVRYDGSKFRTVYLPWRMSDLIMWNEDSAKIVPQPDAYTLMQNILEWLLIPDKVHPELMPSLQTTFVLNDNYPNPFNSETMISFYIPMICEVELTIYNIFGQRVKNLIKGKKAVGNYLIKWDGKNNMDYSVASGIYFCQLKAETFVKLCKMILLR